MSYTRYKLIIEDLADVGTEYTTYYSVRDSEDLLNVISDTLEFCEDFMINPFMTCCEALNKED